jgi:fermentation-respiration switch protein FrsA (DUF1100 family)
LGGSAVIAAAHECQTAAAVASIGAPYQPAHVARNYDALVQRIDADGEAPFFIGGKALTLKRHFVEDVRAADLRQRIRTLRRALLVMHSPTDNTVGIANASEIFRAARHPRSFVSLEGADHLLTWEEPGGAGGPDYQRLGRPLYVSCLSFTTTFKINCLPNGPHGRDFARGSNCPPPHHRGADVVPSHNRANSPPSNNEFVARPPSSRSVNE